LVFRFPMMPPFYTPLGPPPPPLDGAWAKIERAKEHLRDLNAGLDAWKHSPNMFVVKYDSQTGEYVYSLTDLPLRFSTIIGDIAHNLRSSLDVMICGLVRAYGGTVTEGTGFPVWRELPKDVGKAWKRKVHGLPKDACAVVESLQPYRVGESAAGNHPLWLIHELNRLDKHQVLTIIYLAAQMFTMIDYTDDVQFTQLFPFNPGAEVRRSKEPVDMTHQFFAEIAFEPSGPGKGEAVIPRLQQATDFIAKVLEMFRPFIP